MKTKSLKTNAVLNIIRQLCSVLFPLITIPYVTRILHAENYGKVNFAQSVISYFTLIAQMGILNYAVREGAKIREKNDRISSLSNELFSINLLTALLSYTLLAVTVLISVKLQNYTSLIVVYSFTILFNTVGTDWINNIYEDFFYITVRTIAVQVISLVLMFIFVRNEEDFLKYAMVTVFAQGGANILNVFYVRRYIRLRPTAHLNLKKHLKPIVVLFFNNIAMTVYINSDTTMLGFLVDDRAVGIYNIATKIYLVVKHIINAIVNATLPRLSAYAEESKEKYDKLLKQVFESIITVLFPAVTGLFLVSPSVICVLSGAEYIEATSALRILSISLGFAVLAGFFSNCILIPNRLDKYMLYATSAAAIINISLNFFLIPLWSFNGAAVTTVIAECVVMGISLHHSRRVTKVQCSRKVALSVVISCMVICLVCLMVRYIADSYYLRLVLSVVLSVIAYIIIMIAYKNPLFYGIALKVFGSGITNHNVSGDNDPK